jgi:hypothetical protein
MSALIHPKTITVDGLSVRYAEGGQDGPDVILMSPWPESVGMDTAELAKKLGAHHYIDSAESFTRQAR